MLGDDGEFKDYTKFHPGFIHAARISTLKDLGGFLTFCIAGSADRHMLMACLGCVEKSYPKDVSPGYKRALQLWESRAVKYVAGDIGYVPGHCYHFFHGSKTKRRYNERWSILTRNQYDPDTDIKRDVNGLFQFTDRCPALAQELREYFKWRDEDSTSLE